MSSIISYWEQDVSNIIYYEFAEFWQIEDLLSAIDSAKPIYKETNGLIDIIADMQQVTTTPTNLVELKNYLSSLDNRRTGLVIIVSRNRHIRGVGKLLSQLMRSHFSFQFADSLDQAYIMIQRAIATRSAQFTS